MYEITYHEDIKKDLKELGHSVVLQVFKNIERQSVNSIHGT